MPPTPTATSYQRKTNFCRPINLVETKMQRAIAISSRELRNETTAKGCRDATQASSA